VQRGAAHAQSSDTSTGWATAFAAIYDTLFWLGERLGMSSRRRQTLSQARGRTLEIGGGTGSNLEYYPSAVDELIVAEPEAAMRVRLASRLARSGRSASLIDAQAERLPFADSSIDTVVSTLVLCTVDDPGAALREIARVLCPDGQLLFIEHVRSESANLARWQDRLVAPWRSFAVGCRCNRATAALMSERGLELEMQQAIWRGMPPLVRPLIVGRATLQ
jgi:ubiquinone/menaquinone biosynthesis C-methylase UbiE